MYRSRAVSDGGNGNCDNSTPLDVSEDRVTDHKTMQCNRDKLVRCQRWFSGDQSAIYYQDQILSLCPVLFSGKQPDNLYPLNSFSTGVRMFQIVNNDDRRFITLWIDK